MDDGEPEAWYTWEVAVNSCCIKEGSETGKRGVFDCAK